MWPKAFAQFIELAPHISRLLPMADRFFQSKSVNDDANRKAIEGLGDRMRADLNQVTVAHASLSEQMSDLSSAVQRLSSDAAAAKLSSDAVKHSTDALDRRLSAIEARQRRSQLLVGVALLLLVLVLVLQALSLLHAR